MRFSTFINNQKCLEWGLNPNQGALLDYLIRALEWAKSSESHKGFRWVSRQLILRELPLYFKKEDTLYRAIRLLQKKGLIAFIKSGIRDLFAITKKGLEWLGYSKELSERIREKIGTAEFYQFAINESKKESEQKTEKRAVKKSHSIDLDRITFLNSQNLDKKQRKNAISLDLIQEVKNADLEKNREKNTQKEPVNNPVDNLLISCGNTRIQIRKNSDLNPTYKNNNINKKNKTVISTSENGDKATNSHALKAASKSTATATNFSFLLSENLKADSEQQSKTQQSLETQNSGIFEKRAKNWANLWAELGKNKTGHLMRF